jgi:hypothetical protein
MKNKKVIYYYLPANSVYEDRTWDFLYSSPTTLEWSSYFKVTLKNGLIYDKRNKDQNQIFSNKDFNFISIKIDSVYIGFKSTLESIDFCINENYTTNPSTYTHKTIRTYLLELCTVYVSYKKEIEKFETSDIKCPMSIKHHSKIKSMEDWTLLYKAINNKFRKLAFSKLIDELIYIEGIFKFYTLKVPEEYRYLIRASEYELFK